MDGDYVLELVGSDPDSAVEYISESISFLPPNLPLYMHRYTRRCGSCPVFAVCGSCPVFAVSGSCPVFAVCGSCPLFAM